MLFCDRGHGAFGGIGQAIRGFNGEATVLEQRTTLLDIRALEAHHPRDLDADLFHGADDALVDQVAEH
ncbi:MAG: hypothetical protein AAB406_01710, partial [Pseudomonadota bacterium]